MAGTGGGVSFRGGNGGDALRRVRDAELRRRRRIDGAGAGSCASPLSFVGNEYVVGLSLSFSVAISLDESFRVVEVAADALGVSDSRPESRALSARPG